MRTDSRWAWLAGLVLLLSIPGLATDNPATLISADAKSVTLEVTLPPFQMRNVSSHGLTCQEVGVPGWPFIDEAGHPRLPKTGALIDIPAAGSCRISVLEGERDSLKLRNREIQLNDGKPIRRHAP
jgi:hypothetical protein